MRLAVAAALVLLTGTALAEDKADVLFKKGKKLLAEKKYADACAAFTRSDELEPGIGAKLNVGKCFEEWGRLATAMRWYHAAEKLAKDTHDPRVDKIHERIETLDPDVPRLTLRAPKGADLDGEITVDGTKAAIGEDLLVDPGPHVIAYTSATGAKKKTVPLERGASSEVMLDLPARAPNHPTELVVATEHPGHGQRIAGIAVGAAGVVALGVSVGVTLHARGRYRDALAADCMGSTSMCDPAGLATTQSARHQANVATVIAAVGGAAIAGGLVIYLIAPTRRHPEEHALYLAPSIGGDGGGLVVGGAF